MAVSSPPPPSLSPLLVFASFSIKNTYIYYIYILFGRHPDPAQSPLVMSGGEDGTARVMHVQNKRILGTLVHCDAGEVRATRKRDESMTGLCASK